MRIALISDIHGNLVAFEAVLADIQDASADRIVCLGDVAANGPQPHQVIVRLRGLGCQVVRGNTDEWFLLPQTFDPRSEKERRLMEMLRWGEQQLTPADVDFLKTFEPRVEISLNRETTLDSYGHRTLLGYHASPRANMDFFVATTPDEELAPLFEGWHATVMAGGHTHVQMLRHYRGAVLVNPGSVGMPIEPGATPEQNRRPPWAEYAILDSDGESLRIEFRRAPVDKERIIRTVFESGMPQPDWWVKDLL